MSMRMIIPALAAFVSLTAQTTAPSSFEAASIRLHIDAPGNGSDGLKPQVGPGLLVLRNEPLLVLIHDAYDVPRVQIEGPGWLSVSRYDITARASGPANEAQMRLMLQKLLADRLGLKLHRETRAVPVYTLTLAKGGPKFPESPTEGTFQIEHTNSFVLRAHHARLADLAQGISDEIGRPVVDQTGLTGRYEIEMNLTPYVTKAGEGGNPGQLDIMSILFTGLQEILGLKLESGKASVDVLVIDHVEKAPTEN